MDLKWVFFSLLLLKLCYIVILSCQHWHFKENSPFYSYVAFSKIQSASSSIPNSIQSGLLLKWLKTSEQGGTGAVLPLPFLLSFLLCGWATVAWSHVCTAILEMLLMIQSTQVLLDSVTSPDNSIYFLPFLPPANPSESCHVSFPIMCPKQSWFSNHVSSIPFPAFIHNSDSPIIYPGIKLEIAEASLTTSLPLSSIQYFIGLR